MKKISGFTPLEIFSKKSLVFHWHHKKLIYFKELNKRFLTGFTPLEIFSEKRLIFPRHLRNLISSEDLDRRFLTGFTLIELLVVIAIIGILSSLTLVGVSGAQKQARDSQRKSDLNQYRVALETYASANSGYYPGFAGTGVTTIASTSNLCATTGTTTLYSYLSGTCLLDPKNTGTCIAGTYDIPGLKYCYFEDVDGVSATAYVLFGGLETGGWWEICANGKAGKVNTLPGDATCDLP